MKTNEHYRRVSSGGNECARSSRRGAGLTSSSGGLDPDGPQSHAVVTQKRKLRTPVWARLRNIHISSIRYDFKSLPLPLSSPSQHSVWSSPISFLAFFFFHLLLPSYVPTPLPLPSPPWFFHRPFRIRAVDALCRLLCRRTIGSRSRASLERWDALVSFFFSLSHVLSKTILLAITAVSDERWILVCARNTGRYPRNDDLKYLLDAIHINRLKARGI